MVAKKSKTRMAGKLGVFVQQYARKAQKGWEPNDRQYDRKIEQKMKQLRPEELSELLSGDDTSLGEFTVKSEDSK